MLTELFIFSLKASVVLGVLYLAYYVLFRQNTHFNVRRGLLLFIILAACILPGIRLETQTDFFPENPTLQWADALEEVDQAEITLKAHSVQESDQTESLYYKDDTFADRLKEGKLKLIDLVSLLYFLGLSVMLMSFLFQLTKIVYLAVSGPVRHDLDRHTIAHPWIRFPFSFGKWIFVPTATHYDDKTWQMIREHEQAHLQQAHTLDVLVSGLLRCFMWFNPVAHLLHREIKNNHEALADEKVLQNTSIATYSEALLKVSLETGSLTLGHAFALKSNLSKRITTMQRSKTALFKTLATLAVFTIIGFGIFTQTSLYSQQEKFKRPSKEDFLTGRAFVPFGYFKLTPRHQKVMEKLERLYPNKDLRFQYMEEGKPEIYNDRYFDYRKTEYFGKLTDEDKDLLVEVALADTNRIWAYVNHYDFTEEEIRGMASRQIHAINNYIVIYEPLFPEEGGRRSKVYEMDEVDALPRPIGGLEAFERAVALDVEIPEGLTKADLPETIDFSFIVHGGSRITELNLETELRGSRKKNAPIYKFFGTVHNNLRDKIFSFYGWEKGRKDGNQVNVRMVVSIPTKYM